MNLHRKFIKAKTATHGFNLNDKSFSYGFVLLMIENHQFSLRETSPRTT